jgi:hypothetical protein
MPRKTKSARKPSPKTSRAPKAKAIRVPRQRAERKQVGIGEISVGKNTELRLATRSRSNQYDALLEKALGLKVGSHVLFKPEAVDDLAKEANRISVTMRRRYPKTKGNFQVRRNSERTHIVILRKS